MKKTTLLVLVLAMLCGYSFAASPVYFAWDASTTEGVTGYIIKWGEFDIEKGPVDSLVHEVDVGNTLKYKVSDLEDNKVYVFAVMAYEDKNKKSGYSTIIKFKTVPQEIRSVPDVPENFKKNKFSSFSWDAVEGIDGYTFRWGVFDETKGENESLVSSVNVGNNTEFEFLDFEPDIEYVFAVSAYNKRDETARSNIIKTFFPPEKIIELPSMPEKFIILFDQRRVE